jgi:uncharacterized protein with PIN domain
MSMGVPCPGCGRSYDVALFQFGRTIDCRCGSRVGIEPRVRRLSAEGRPTFMADAMLGRLARWLRILGYDTAWEEHISDEALVRRALEEERIILTRDRSLGSEWRVSGIGLVQAEEPVAQLAEVAAAFDLGARSRPFTRCSRCNTELVAADRDAARGRVPPRILERFARFQRCPGCDRIYWDGSHTDRMRRVLAQTLGVGVARATGEENPP